MSGSPLAEHERALNSKAMSSRNPWQRKRAARWKRELFIFGLAAPFGACVSYYAMGSDTWLGEGMAPIGLLGIIACLTCWFGYLVRVLVQLTSVALRLMGRILVLPREITEAEAGPPRAQE